MKDSGIDWIGEIPEEWKIIKTKYLLQINNGTDPKQEGDIPVYGSGDRVFKTCGEFKEPPAVLLGRKGTIENAKYVNTRYWNVDTAFDAKPINDFLNLKFYYYCANSFDYKYYVSQTTLPSMTQSNYENMFIPLLNNSEQCFIVLYLDRQCTHIDNIIEKTKTSIEEYKKLKQAVITQAVTKGIRGNREMKDSGIDWIGEIPKSFLQGRGKTHSA